MEAVWLNWMLWLPYTFSLLPGVWPSSLPWSCSCTSSCPTLPSRTCCRTSS